MSSASTFLPVWPDHQVLACHDGAMIHRGRFLADVDCVAARLPAVSQVINLCHDRYWFAVSLLACASKGVVSLLPNSPAPEALARLGQSAPEAWVMVDRDAPPPLALPRLHVPDSAARSEPLRSGPEGPSLHSDQHVATVFTSGSTGQPQAHAKRWGNLRASVESAARRVWAVTGGPCSVIGTPSFRHMYGLESTVLLPLLGGGRLTSTLPFFPADVAQALDEAPEPRLLVTTPFHLRKLMESGVTLPRLSGLLSATAPLAPAIARAAEVHFDAPLLEVYGATEIGQIATRRPCTDEVWELLEGHALTELDGSTIVTGPTQPQPQPLNDVIELDSPTRFRLVDRAANMINIVGKRASLAHLNHLLSQVPGVLDGVFCLPEPAQPADNARLAAFVVAPDLQPADILAALRPLVDAVFLPRPLVLVPDLPRDRNGKITSATLRHLTSAHLTVRS